MLARPYVSLRIVIIVFFILQSNLHNLNFQGTAQNSSNCGKFELLELIYKDGNRNGPGNLLGIIESSNFRNSNYGGWTVL